jgi:hypothetical protein
MVALTLTAHAQQTSINSHQVNADASVTLRYYAPTAGKVVVSLDYDHNHLILLSKGADGVWILTTGALDR